VKLEFSADNVAIAQSILEHAGVADRVTIVHGTLGDGGRTAETLHRKHGFGPDQVDFAFNRPCEGGLPPRPRDPPARALAAQGRRRRRRQRQGSGGPEYHAFIKAKEGTLFRTHEHSTHTARTSPGLAFTSGVSLGTRATGGAGGGEADVTLGAGESEGGVYRERSREREEAKLRATLDATLLVWNAAVCFFSWWRWPLAPRILGAWAPAASREHPSRLRSTTLEARRPTPTRSAGRARRPPPSEPRAAKAAPRAPPRAVRSRTPTSGIFAPATARASKTPT